MQEGNTYSLKKIIIFGIILLIIGGLVGFYFINKKNNPNDQGTSGKNTFPFGDGTSSGTTPGNTGGTIDDQGVPQIPVDTGTIATTNAERLRQITQYPVTNFFGFQTTRTVLEPKLDEKTGQTSLVPMTLLLNNVRWNIKQTGIIMDAELSDDAIITQQKTDTRIPVAEELWIARKGSAFGFRTWNGEARTIDTVLGTLPPEPTLSYCTLPFTQNLVPGSKTSDVKELQKYLNMKLSLNLAVDGSLGPKTFTLITKIQNILGIAESGLYDETTKEAINTDCGKIVTSFNQEKAQPAKLQMSLLPKNITRGAVSPDGSQLFFLVPMSGFGISGIVSNSDGSGQKKVFESPASEWSAQWVTKDLIALTTLASRESPGYLYFLNPTTGDFKKILGPIRGLTTLVAPDGKRIIYSSSTDRGIVTRLYTLETGALKNLDLATLPEKCIWQDASIVICGVPKLVPGGQYPDSWYQGLVSFSDVVWKIDATNNTTSLILSPDQSFDIVKPQLSPDRSYFYFINKSDQTLWSYRL